MLNMSNASWSVGQDEKRNGQLRQPLREHELLGLPKSTGKKGNMNTTVIDRPLLQPIRLKDLFVSPEIKKSTKKSIPARRMTTMPIGMSNASEKFRIKPSPATSATAAFSCQKPSLHRQGLSKSEGKTKGFRRFAPENMKHLVESWETCQTTQPAAHKSRPIETRNQNVRRKLYGVFQPSPAAIPKNNRKSMAQNAVKSQKSDIADSKIVQSHVRKSIKPDNLQSRKSCLPPPNSIREKYVNLRHNETRTGDTLSKKMENASKNSEKNDDPAGNLEKSEQCDFSSLKNLSSNETFSIETNNSDVNEEEKVCEEISRPTVIMGISTKKTGKQQEVKKLDESNDNEKVSLPNSCLPLQESNKNTSLLQSKLNVSFSENHQSNISRLVRGESFCYENLPHNSFLESTTATKNSFVSMDRQTLFWIHGNLKLNVQSMEEQLFTMKRILNTIEDALKNHEDAEITEVRLNNESDDNSPLLKAPSFDKKNNGVLEPKIDQESEINDKIVNNLPERLEVSIKAVENLSNHRKSTRRVSNIDEDKENNKNGSTPRRRSARLAEKSLKTPKTNEDSFLEIEQDLNIIHLKTKKTPLNVKSGKRLDSRTRKSVREYMALKSASNFLATPNMKGFPTPKGEKNTPLHSQMERRSLSRKLLAELDDLYAESPS